MPNLNAAVSRALKTVSLSFPDDMWEPTGSEERPWSRLLGPILYLNGLPMHMEAYAVQEDANNLQQFADIIFEPEEQGLYLITSNAVQTTTINGREYAIVITPHGA